MRPIIIFVVINFLLFHKAVSQNIVRNGELEELSQCPTSPGELSYAQPWYSGGESPDLLNICCNSDRCRVPSNIMGFQIPLSGGGYAFIATYDIIFQNAREFMMQPLEYRLEANSEYYFEMNVSLADCFNRATHNIGAVLVDTILNPWLVLDCVLDGSFDCNPVVENTSANPLTSKTEWTKISGTFTAQGGEKYIFIGNVRPDSLTEVEYVGGGAPNGEYNWEGSGYYIDDVWLSHIDSMHYAGVGDLREPTFAIWPNPADDMLNVEFHDRNRTGLVIEVKDLFGRSVLAASANSSKFQMDISELRSGVYCVVVKDRAGGMLVQKVVKE